MNPEDLLIVQKTITAALANADSFNKICNDQGETCSIYVAKAYASAGVCMPIA
ncbi:hypothetical protein ACIPLR_26260 [Herbaspirillum huttiense]|jgi:hypothetical protein|uniref:hypothetical protein n=1 Tax=Herbaspirillum huttiense TaxID=863372 RepID=UPI00382D83A1